MAGIDLGGLLGAASQLTTAFSKERSLKSFLINISKFGVQVKNNFEVNFSGLQDATFFIQSIEIPGLKQNFCTVNYDGQVVDVPINFDFDHDFNMTVYNDAQGYIYSALQNFIMGTATTSLCPAGYTMTIKALTGDTHHFAGALVTLEGVRIATVSGLSWGHEDNAIQTFTVGGKLTSFTYTPGALQKAAGILGAANSILG